MTIREYLEAKKKEIEADSRFKAKPASVQINAPLALIQVQLHAEHGLITAALKYEPN